MEKTMFVRGMTIWKDVNGGNSSQRLDGVKPNHKYVVIPTGKTTTYLGSEFRPYIQVITPHGLGWVRKDFVEFK